MKPKSDGTHMMALLASCLLGLLLARSAQAVSCNSPSSSCPCMRPTTSTCPAISPLTSPTTFGDLSFLTCALDGDKAFRAQAAAAAAAFSLHAPAHANAPALWAPRHASNLYLRLYRLLRPAQPPPMHLRYGGLDAFVLLRETHAALKRLSCILHDVGKHVAKHAKVLRISHVQQRLGGQLQLRQWESGGLDDASSVQLDRQRQRLRSGGGVGLRVDAGASGCGEPTRLLGSGRHAAAGNFSHLTASPDTGDETVLPVSQGGKAARSSGDSSSSAAGGAGAGAARDVPLAAATPPTLLSCECPLAALFPNNSFSSSGSSGSSGSSSSSDETGTSGSSDIGAIGGSTAARLRDLLAAARTDASVLVARLLPAPLHTLVLSLVRHLPSRHGLLASVSRVSGPEACLALALAATAAAALYCRETSRGRRLAKSLEAVRSECRAGRKALRLARGQWADEVERMRGSAEEAEGRWRKDLEGARATSQLQGCRLELERGRQKEELLQAWRAGEDGDDDCEVQVTSSSNDQHQCQQQQQQQQQQQRQQPQQRQQERDDEGGDTGDAAVLREQLQLTRGALRQLADSAQVVRQQLLTQLASTRVDVHQLQACVQTQGAFVSALLRGLRARQRAEREEAKQRAQELERSRAEAAAQVQAMKEVLQVQIRSWNLPTRSFAPAELATILSALAVAGVVDHAFLDRLLGLARPQLRLGGFSARELSATAHAVASLGHRPERAFMSDLLSQAFERLSAFEPRDLAHLLWALGRLGVVPDAFGSGPAGGITGEEKDKSRGLVRELLRRCCEAPAALAALAPHELADVAWALCASGVLPSAPPASAGAVAGAASSGRGGEGRRGPGEGASVGAAGVSPSSSGSGHQGPGDSAGAAEAEAAAFLQALLSAARAQLPAFEPRDLAALAHALSKLVGAGGAGEAGQQGGATQAGGPATAAAAAAGDDGAGVRPFVGELMQQARSRSRRLGPEARRQLAHAARAFGLDEVVVQLTGS